MDEFFDAYAMRRETGAEPGTALREAVADVVPWDFSAEVIAMLSGQLDPVLSVSEPFDGRRLRSDLVQHGDEHWLRLRADPTWADRVRGLRPAAAGAGPAPGRPDGRADAAEAQGSGPNGTFPEPEVALNSYVFELMVPYREARRSRRPLDAFTASVLQVVPPPRNEELRLFSMGALDRIHGEGAGYRSTRKFLIVLEASTGSSQTPEERLPRWRQMSIGDVAGEIASDQFHLALFLWSRQHDMESDASALVSQMATDLVDTASSARTKRGRQARIDQAVKVLDRLSATARASGDDDQEAWCRLIAAAVTEQRARVPGP